MVQIGERMSLIQGQGTKATKIDASAGLLRKVNKKLDRIIELLEHSSTLNIKERMSEQRGMTKERDD